MGFMKKSADGELDESLDWRYNMAPNDEFTCFVKKNHSCVSNESLILHEELSVITTKLLMGYYTLLNCLGWTSLTRISLSLL